MHLSERFFSCLPFFDGIACFSFCQSIFFRVGSIQLQSNILLLYGMFHFVQIHIYLATIFYSPSIVKNSFSGPLGYCNLCHAFVDTGYQQQQLEQYVLCHPAFSAGTVHPDRIMHPHLRSIVRSICACHFLTYCPDLPTYVNNACHLLSPAFQHRGHSCCK